MSGVVEARAAFERARNDSGYSRMALWAMDHGRLLLEAAETPSPWQPIETAKKDRTTIWAVFHPRIYPDLEPERPDLATWNGVQICLRHFGIVEYDDGPFDQGWGIAAPVGQGGFPDRWIAGWMPLPAAPADGGVA